MTTWKNQIVLSAKKAVKSILYNPPLDRFFLHQYLYPFQPAHLAFLCQCIDQTRLTRGAIVEIGCASGHTAVFLNKHMDAAEIEKPYICIDTFAGFTSADIEHEVQSRGKTTRELLGFRANKKAWFDRTMTANGIKRVRSIEADINELDPTELGDVSFCLVDVDLYRPVKAALEKTFPRLSPGGIIVVDDCRARQSFDGALAAYEEFAAKHGLERELLLGKLGVFRKG